MRATTAIVERFGCSLNWTTEVFPNRIVRGSARDTPTRQDDGIEEQINPPTSRHAALLDQAVQALRQDDRVLAVLVGGSLASGDADEESDIDLTMVVDDAVADAFNHERQWLERMHP